MLRSTFPSDLTKTFRGLPDTPEALVEHMSGSLRDVHSIDNKLSLFTNLGYTPHEGYHPYAGQMDVHKCAKRFTLIRAGRRFGKSTLAAMEAVFRAQMPRQVIWIVAPEYSLTDRVFRPLWRILHGQMGIRFLPGSSESNRIIRLPNETIIEGKSLDNEQSLIGEAVNLLIIDEVQLCKQSLWNERLLPAITGATVKGHVKMIGTPEPGHWTNDLFDDVERRQDTEEEDPDWHVFWAPSWINTKLYPGGYDDPDIKMARRNMNREAFNEQYAARPRRPRLQVFREYEKAVHVRPDVEFDPNADVLLGLDPGSANGYGVVALQVNIEKRCVNVIDEYEEAGSTAYDVWLNLARRPWWKKVKIAVIDDAALSDRLWWVRKTISSTSGLSIPGPGIVCIPAYKQRTENRVSVPSGINLIKQYLRDPGGWDEYLELQKRQIAVDRYEKEFDDLDIDRQDDCIIEAEETCDINMLRDCSSIFFSDRCVQLADEINKYRYRESRIEGRNISEEPEKKYDHLVDALRYVLWSLDPLGKKFGARRSPETTGSVLNKDGAGLTVRPRSSAEVIG